MFLFLYDYFVEIITIEFFEKLDVYEKDIFIKLRQIVLLKLELIKKYPHIFNFIIAANIEDSNEIKTVLNTNNKEFITNSYNRLFKDIDISNFREGIDIKRAINIIIWTTEGFRNQELEKVKLPVSFQNNYEESMAELDVYMDILKKVLYK